LKARLGVAPRVRVFIDWVIGVFTESGDDI